MIFGGFEKSTLIDYPGKIASVVFTIGCNFRCPYCHNPELVNKTIKKTIDEQDVLNFLDNRKSMIDGLVITGGEPTIYKDDLLQFIKKVKEKGFLVKLDSNGTNPDFFKKVIEEKLVDYIAMDMKAPLRKYSQTVARPVDVDKIRESINLLLQSPIDYEFRTTVVKSITSPDDLREIGQEIKGAKKYYLQQFIPTKILNPQFKKKTTYTKDELKSFREMMKNYVDYCEIR